MLFPQMIVWAIALAPGGLEVGAAVHVEMNDQDEDNNDDNRDDDGDGDGMALMNN